jgi:hypothetical protein
MDESTMQKIALFAGIVVGIGIIISLSPREPKRLYTSLSAGGSDNFTLI